MDNKTTGEAGPPKHWIKDNSVMQVPKWSQPWKFENSKQTLNAKFLHNICLLKIIYNASLFLFLYFTATTTYLYVSIPR